MAVEATPDSKACLNIDEMLRSTRQEGVREPIALPGGEDFIDPELLATKRQVNWGVLRREKAGESFLLIERRFTGVIDEIFGRLPSRLIEYYLENKKVDPVRILDIGGGRDGAAAKDIAQTYLGVDVANIDIVAVNERSGNFTSKQGDVINLQLPDASIDLAYSHQVLPFMSTKDNFERPVRAIEEATRVLRPGGVALIDLTNGPISQDVLISLNQRIQGKILPKRKRYERSYIGAFLVIVRPPVESTILEFSASVPDLVA